VAEQPGTQKVLRAEYADFAEGSREFALDPKIAWPVPASLSAHSLAACYWS
jgi:hypothetical protein